jgi:hypothetical protein
MKNSFQLAFVVFVERALCDLIYPGIFNPFYPATGYIGSRVLETNYLTNIYADIIWSQTASVDGNGNVYIADKARNSIILSPANTSYIGFPSAGSIFAGSASTQGYRDGTLGSSLLNSPKGVAFYESSAGRFLYVADTGNHCIRRIDLTGRNITTIAGTPGSTGQRDGDGRKAQFNSPTSLGVDPATGVVFVHDNNQYVRMLNITETGKGLSPSVRVSTLISGACRSIDENTTYETIITRTVRCQTGWIYSSPGSTDKAEEWEWPSICVGNSVTCDSRNEL